MKRHGFTLIELLVVIAIIAILAAILFPVFAKAREKARQTSCANNQRQIVAAILMSAQDHDETFPGATWTIDLASTYGLTGKVWDCPTTSRKATESQPDYAYSSLVTDKALGDIASPATTIVTADGWHEATPAQPGPPPVPATLSGLLYTGSDFALRHNGTFVAGYADGHIANTKRHGFWPGLTTKLWLAADESLITSGTIVTQWNDKSGNGYNAMQTTAALRPTVLNSAINDKPAVYFNGTQRMEITNSFTVAQIFSVFRSTAATFSNYGCTLGNASGQTRMYCFQSGDTYFHSNPAPPKAYKDGKLLTTTGTRYSDMGAINKYMVLTIDGNNAATARTYQVGAFEDGYMAQMEIAEIIAFDTVQSDANRQAIEEYLMTKYGL